MNRFPAVRCRPAPPARRAAGVCVVALAAALLGACEAAVVLDLEVDGDGSGRVEVRLETDEAAVAAVDRAVAEAEAEGVADVAVSHPLDAFAATIDDLEDWELTDTGDGDGGRTIAAATTVDDPGELEAVTADLADALDAPEGRLLGPVAAAVGEDTVRLDGELAADVDPAAALGWADPPDDLRVDGEPLDRVVGGDDGPLAVRLTTTLPGPVIETDADEVDGQTLTWHGEPGAVREVHAVAERPLGSQRPWLLGGAVTVAVAAVIGVAGLVARRRRRG